MQPVKINNKLLYLIYVVISVILLIYFIDLSRVLTLIVSLLAIAFISLLVFRYKRFLLLLLAFLIPLSFQFSVFETSRVSVPAELICLLLSGFFISKILLGYKVLKSWLYHPLTLLILLDLGWMFITCCFSQMPQVSFKRFIIRFMYYCSFYYFYFELFREDPKNIRKVFLLHVLGFISPILFSLFRHSSSGFSTLGIQMIHSPFYYDHTIYGACLVFFIPFLIFQTIQSQTTAKKFFFSVLSFLFILSAILSYSRAAWISSVIALMVYLLVLYRVKFKTVLYFAFVLVIIFTLNRQTIISLLESNTVESHSNDITLHIKSISNINTDASNKERINRWKCAIRMFIDKPFFGFGPGTYQFFYGKFQQHQDLTRISTFKGNKGHAHSEYLNYLSETGLIGLLIFLGIIFTACYKLIVLIQSDKDDFIKTSSAFIFMGLVTFIVHGFFNGFIEFDKVAMPVFSSLAAIVALEHFKKKETISPHY